MIKEALEFIYQKATAAAAQRARHEAIVETFYLDSEGAYDCYMSNRVARLEVAPAHTEVTDRVYTVDAMRSLMTDTGPSDSTVFVGKTRVVAVHNGTGWRGRQIVMSLVHSDRLHRWRAMGAVSLDNVADAVAERIDDVVDEQNTPSPAQIMEAFGGVEWSDFADAKVKHTSDGVKMTSTSGEKVTNLPGQFQIAVPMYEHDTDEYRLDVRVSAKKVNGKRCIRFGVCGVDRLQRAARDRLISQLCESLKGATVLEGEPGDVTLP